MYFVPKIESFNSRLLFESIGPAQTNAYLNFDLYMGASLYKKCEYRYCKLTNGANNPYKIISKQNSNPIN